MEKAVFGYVRWMLRLENMTGMKLMEMGVCCV